MLVDRRGFLIGLVVAGCARRVRSAATQSGPPASAAGTFAVCATNSDERAFARGVQVQADLSGVGVEFVTDQTDGQGLARCVPRTSGVSLLGDKRLDEQCSVELFLSLSRQTQVDDDTQLQEFVIGSTNFIEAQAVALLASQLSSDTVGVLWSGVTSERDRAVDVFMFSRFIRTGSTFSRLRERACEILDRLRTSGCGVLIAAGDAKVGAELAKCLDQMKWSVPLVGFSDWNRGERLVRASGPLYCVDVFSPDEVGQVAFVEEFIARHGSVPCTLAALGADAVSLAIYARKLDRVSQLRGPLFRPPEFITGPFDFDSRRIAARRSMAAIRLGPETSEFVQRLAVPI